MATLTVVSDGRGELPVATTVNESTKLGMNKGAWIAEEDVKLAEAITTYGAKKWKIIAAKAGLNRCGKSCRLRWLNYLRPNIKRGNFSDEEEDLILRLHKLLGNRWSLIAGRLPGRTDNEIKNYWNSHLSKKIKQKEKKQVEEKESFETNEENRGVGGEKSKTKLDVDDFFDFSNEDPLNLQWMGQFLELNERFS